MRTILLSIFCLVSFLAISYTQELQSRVFKTPFGEELPYQVYHPSSDKKVPLILFLHGAGERGQDNQKQSVHVVPQILNFMKEEQKEAFILAPQCPKNQLWVNVMMRQAKEHKLPEFPSTPLRLTYELVQNYIENYSIDKARIYIVGLSMGGFGTWDLISRKPKLFAAAVPICGGGDSTLGPQLIQLPIWAWHGDQDKVILVERSRDMIQAISQAGGQPKYTELKGVGHNSWNEASNSKDLWDWLFSQKKFKQ